MSTDFSLLRPYAAEIKLLGPELEKSAAGFIQPVDVEKPETEKRFSRAGTVDGRRYSLIIQADSLEGVTEVELDRRRYELLRWENVCGSHVEGLLRLKAGEADA